MPTTKPATRTPRSKPTGRPPIEPTVFDVALVEKLAGLGLTLDQIAAALGWSPATLDRKLKEPELAAAYGKGRALAAQSMASRLWDIAMSNDEKGIPTKQATTAAIFWLKAQAKWSERLTLELDNSEPENQIQIYLPDNSR